MNFKFGISILVVISEHPAKHFAISSIESHFMGKKGIQNSRLSHFFHQFSTSSPGLFAFSFSCGVCRTVKKDLASAEEARNLIGV